MPLVHLFLRLLVPCGGPTTVGQPQSGELGQMRRGECAKVGKAHIGGSKTTEVIVCAGPPQHILHLRGHCAGRGRGSTFVFVLDLGKIWTNETAKKKRQYSEFHKCQSDPDRSNLESSTHPQSSCLASQKHGAVRQEITSPARRRSDTTLGPRWRDRAAGSWR